MLLLLAEAGLHCSVVPFSLVKILLTFSFVIVNRHLHQLLYELWCAQFFCGQLGEVNIGEPADVLQQLQH